MSKNLPLALAAVVASLAVSSIALAAGGLAGTYTTTVKSPAELKGKWSITFAQGGSYKVAWNGETVARGAYRSTPTTVTLSLERGSSCKGAGTYAWKRSGKTVAFTKRRESASCPARAAVLSHPFTRTG